MRLVAFLILLSIPSALIADESSTAGAQSFRAELAARVAALEKKNAAAFVGMDGWLFLTSELRFLAQEIFWGEAAAKIGRARKAEAAMRVVGAQKFFGMWSKIDDDQPPSGADTRADPRGSVARMGRRRFAVRRTWSGTR